MDMTRILMVAGITTLLLAWVCRRSGEGEGQAAAAQTHPVQTEDSGRRPNRLVHETSPYLLQHAYNPVDWYPWGEEAFARAQTENKPIFLSVGYSTCHWCHVMERESFSNPQIAEILNRHFVSIKVDREERPDVDQVYMAYVQAATGRGGWPMSVFLTPGLKPFFGGTYFPPEEFARLLRKVAEEWEENQERILESAGNAIQVLQEFQQSSGPGQLELESELLAKTYRYYAGVYDEEDGGFGPAPKFPRPVDFYFLFRYHWKTGSQKALEMAIHTLRQMARGGIRDHLGGGFHRYSTDSRWFLPHFEKMLYDQAQLAVAYLEAYQLSGDPEMEAVAREIFTYALREMRDPGGAFYSAEDADSPLPDNPQREGEGAFYVWSQEEIERRLGKGDAAVFAYVYGVRTGGNVEVDPFGEFEGKNVLHLAHTVQQAAQRFGMSEREVSQVLRRSRQTLLEARSQRPRPHRDDKALTSWNGLMISALAKGYQVLNETAYLEAAREAAAFVAEQLYDPRSGTLKRRYRQGVSGIEGVVDDYAFFIQGLLDLYETSFEDRWLLLAMDLTETQNRHFWDDKNGGSFATSGKDPSILIRMKEDYDGAEPSPNSVAVLNLLRLSQMAHRPRWQEMAEQAVQAFHRTLRESLHGMPHMMAALGFRLGKPKQILIAGQRGSSDTQALLREVHRLFLPYKVVVLADGGQAHQRLAQSLEVLDRLREVDSKATAYICEDYVCQLPTNDPQVVARLLAEGSPPAP